MTHLQILRVLENYFDPMRVEKSPIKIDCWKDVRTKNQFWDALFCIILHDIIYQGIVSSFIIVLILVFITNGLFDSDFFYKNGKSTGLVIFAVRSLLIFTEIKRKFQKLE